MQQVNVLVKKDTSGKVLAIKLPNCPVLGEGAKEDGWSEQVADLKDLPVLSEETQKQRESNSGMQDVRCAVCGHAPESHFVGSGCCYRCPCDRRCMGYVRKQPA